MLSNSRKVTQLVTGRDEAGLGSEGGLQSPCYLGAFRGDGKGGGRVECWKEMGMVKRTGKGTKKGEEGCGNSASSGICFCSGEPSVVWKWEGFVVVTAHVGIP